MIIRFGDFINESNVPDIQLVADTLITEVFDEFNIEEYRFVDDFIPPEYRYWSFIGGGKPVITKMKPSDRIIIGNLDDSYVDVMNELHVLRPIIRGRSGVEFDIKCKPQYILIEIL